MTENIKRRHGKSRSNNALPLVQVEMDRYFIDALRNWLGKDPLYQNKETRSPEVRQRKLQYQREWHQRKKEATV